jgi:ubiquinone/menaquinone biosynthesis C-methylase UbiE
VSNTDRDWEWYGAHDPYFGVVSHGRYRREQLDEDARRAFFETGRAHVEALFASLESALGIETLKPRRALDFGCGVGRIVLPLAERCGEVVGVDVAPSMLEEAERNCRERDLRNVHLVLGDDELSRCTGSFDLVHSFIVFQHVPVARGLRLLDALLRLLEPGGVGALHFTHDVPSHRSLKHLLRTRPVLRQLNNLRLGKPLNEPSAEMNDYDLRPVLRRLQDAGARRVVAELTDHGGARGALLLFRKGGPGPT